MPCHLPYLIMCFSGVSVRSGDWQVSPSLHTSKELGNSNIPGPLPGPSRRFPLEIPPQFLVLPMDKGGKLHDLYACQRHMWSVYVKHWQSQFSSVASYIHASFIPEMTKQKNLKSQLRRLTPKTHPSHRLTTASRGSQRRSQTS